MYRQYTQVAANTVAEVQLEGRGVLKFECDWGVGIGGGLWSTGILLTQHLCKHAALYDSVFRGKRVLELGSGTGLVGEGIRSAYRAHSPSFFSSISENQELCTAVVHRCDTLYSSVEEIIRGNFLTSRDTSRGL